MPTSLVPPTTKLTLPEGPPSHPLWQMMQWISQPIQMMNRCGQRYGDRFTLRLGNLGAIVFLSHPQAIQDVFTADPATFDIGQSNRLLIPLLGNTSIILLDGDRHQRQRQLLMPPFHGERMRAYGDLMQQITVAALADWTVGQTRPVRPLIQAISLEVILKAVFGVTDGPRYAALRQLLPHLLDMVGSPLRSSLLFLPNLQQDLGAWSPWGRFLRQRSQLDQLLYSEIAERRQQLDPDRTDILSLMLAARDEAGQPMTDAELRDELLTLLFVGHETTASAISWALYWIHRDSTVQERLVTELTTQADLWDGKTLGRLPYLGAICNETLRIYPIAPITFPRILRAPYSIRGETFPAGAWVAPCVYLTHRRPELYPQPEQFVPERFLERSFSPFEFIPFGGGNRRCLGMAFALFEMKYVLATLLTTAQFQLTNASPLRPSRRGVTLAPPDALSLKLEARY